jgi:hypothetical protein
MPIIERTPRACFEVFTDHMRALVAATVTARHPLQMLPSGSRMILSFREEDPVAVPIDTAYGRLYFYLGQSLEAVEDPGGYRLKTRQYWYRLQPDAAFRSRATMRWEYDAFTREDHHARHHAQTATTVALADAELDLDKAHVPTGWVTVEEVIRFLIVDLAMTPPCGEQWPAVIAESETRFFQEFTGKRYEPRDALR